MPYLIANTASIQVYLGSGDSVSHRILIVPGIPATGGEYSETDAIALENISARVIVEWLDFGWQMTEALASPPVGFPSANLIDLVSELTAAKIYYDRHGLTGGRGTPLRWADRLVSEVYDRLARIYLAHSDRTFPNVTRVSLPLETRQMLALTRDRGLWEDNSLR